MKKMILAVAFLGGVLTFASCDSGTNDQQNTAATGTPVVAPDTAITEEKQELMVYAARNNMLQMELGRLATEHGNTEGVRVYGQRLMDWYSDKQAQLREMAQQYNVTLPLELNDEQAEHVEELQNTAVTEFDEKYWEELADAQQKAINEFDNTLKDVEESDATAFSIWARDTRKELQAQMEQAKSQDFMQGYDTPTGVRDREEEGSGARIGN
ncbi:DUF4142 domain-containing protein [Pontibacter diazotrophicus]|uniref:DUF4142 domain-containing protein n=1 Tax=Pontibacter diazotrophicus TaxID=1400979 RepID=A0A3D8LIJ4_9BACT|nr:DUF4142 domain-containing protein [Pontibacter diazotrophicus]RDV17136.1 DUF4142 domain-containing protein [Pontibacter diazotrophicus]